jgi:hypothetical protein
MRRALGISIHTGWGACVVVAGSREAPAIIANEIIEILDCSERFCFHRAAEMKRAAAEAWIAQARHKALTNATRALTRLVRHDVSLCALIAKESAAGDLGEALASHARIHRAEGCFYRDVLRDASPVPVRLVPPSTLDPSKVGRLAPPPWSRDQKLAALAAWSVISTP